MLEGREASSLNSKTVMDWMIKEEPKLVKMIYDYFFNINSELSFDSEENTKRLEKVRNYFEKNSEIIYSSLNKNEKLLLYIMKNGFGWIVYENIESTLRIISKIFHFDYNDLSQAVDSLFKKFLIFKYERIKRYSFFFSPPFFLKSINKFT